MIGSLGFGAVSCLTAACFGTFGSAAGAAFLGAGVSDGAPALGFGAVIDGNGGDATVDADVPIFIRNYSLI